MKRKSIGYFVLFMLALLPFAQSAVAQASKGGGS